MIVLFFKFERNYLNFIASQGYSVANLPGLSLRETREAPREILQLFFNKKIPSISKLD